MEGKRGLIKGGNPPVPDARIRAGLLPPAPDRSRPWLQAIQLTWPEARSTEVVSLL